MISGPASTLLNDSLMLLSISLLKYWLLLPGVLQRSFGGIKVKTRKVTRSKINISKMITSACRQSSCSSVFMQSTGQWKRRVAPPFFIGFSRCLQVVASRNYLFFRLPPALRTPHSPRAIIDGKSGRSALADEVVADTRVCSPSLYMAAAPQPLLVASSVVADNVEDQTVIFGMADLSRAWTR
jgi:hypothetical protein